MSYFYKCGALDHVIGRCLFAYPATVTSANRIVAKLYGPWLRSENDSSLLFINPTLEKDKKNLLSFVRCVEEEKSPAVDSHLLIDSLTKHFNEYEKVIIEEEK